MSQDAVPTASVPSITDNTEEVRGMVRRAVLRHCAGESYRYDVFQKMDQSPMGPVPGYVVLLTRRGTLLYPPYLNPAVGVMTWLVTENEIMEMIGEMVAALNIQDREISSGLNGGGHHGA